MNNRVKNIVIVGGGTAGWMAAAALSKAFGQTLSIELVESEEIGTVGVGEATIPPIRNLHLLFDLSEADFVRAVNGTFKLGIEFENWGALGERYFHPFSGHGIDTWAAQFHHYWIRARQFGEKAPLDHFSLEAHMARANRFGLSLSFSRLLRPFVFPSHSFPFRDEFPRSRPFVAVVFSELLSYTLFPLAFSSFSSDKP